MNIYVEQIKEIVLGYMKHEPVSVFLFGSWARGTAHHGSDVDVAVAYDDGMPHDLEIDALRELLEESTVPYRVDVVDMSRASQALLQEIRKEGIRWK